MTLSREILLAQRQECIARLRKIVDYQEEHKLKMRIDDLEEQLSQLTN